MDTLIGGVPAAPDTTPMAVPSPVAGEGTATTDPADPLIGTTVADRYRLLERLGAGGMGAVYRGEHLSLRKRVAVKFLHREMTSNQELVTRFEREAVAAANLDHPNVVAATDFGRLADGTFFLVMEYVEGRSLRKLLQEDRLPIDRAQRILRQVAAALTRAHALGIVHRDLKPENVVITDREGERDVVKVIDFGIARVTGSAFGAEGPALTQMGAVFGTPEYMAPEQAMGQRVDGRADQYAYGVMAYEMFAGRRPFVAEDAIDLLRMHVGAPVPPATSLAGDLPPALDEVLARMLAKRPEERFESVQAAVAAIERVLAGRSFVPPSPRISSPMPQPTSPILALDPSKRAGLLVALGCFVLLALGLAFVTRHGSRSSPPSSGTVDTRPIAERMASYQTQPDVSEALSRSLRGDVDGAASPLHTRLDRNPHDALAAYFLGTVYWNARRTREAVDAFVAAVRNDAALADDPTLTHAMVAALGDPETAGTAEAVLRTAPLAQSVTVARAVADEAIAGSSADAHGTALALAASMSGLLPPLDQARIRLRLADNCEQLRAALGALESLGGAGAEEAAVVREGGCDMLRMGPRCRDCLEGHGHGHGH